MGCRIARALVVVAVVVAAGTISGRAAAAGFAVDTTADTHDVAPGDGACADLLGDCSLRAAIEEANALAGADVITVPDGTYTLTLGELQVTDGLTLAGAGASTTIVVPAPIAPSRVFDVSAPSTMSGLAISNGLATGDGDGGGVLTTATLTLDHVIVSGNTATGTGGGIAADGPSGSLVLTDSTVSGNHAQAGGGILLQSDPNVGLLVRDTITGNTAVPGDIPGLGDGGGIRAAGVITVVNSTVNGNSATTGGGGLINFHFAHLVNDTFADNTAPAGAQLWNDEIPGQFDLVNTIVSGASPALNCGANQLPLMTSLGHNLDNGTGCGFTAAGDLSGVDPLLGPPASNGGPTQTMALLPGSPAIDAGDDAACPATDQRGVIRPQGVHCDIGAFERVQLFLIHVSVELHILDRRKTGACPGPAASCFLPGAGVLVRIFDLNSPVFQAAWGTSKPNQKLFAPIFVADVGDVGSCTTGSDGLCTVQVQIPGDYLVIARLLTPSSPLYDGRIIAPNDFTATQDGGDAGVMLRLKEIVS